MKLFLWVIIGAVLVLGVALAIAVLYFRNFAVLRANERKKEMPHPETEFERLYKARIQNGIQWFKAQSPQRLYTESFDGLKLAADYLPAENPRGTVIAVHGYRSSNLRDFSCVFELYHSWGFNILAVHDRAHGASEGKYIGFGILDRYDVLCWSNYVKENIGGHTVLDGLSMGATAVLMASGLDLPENVKCIIADCGFTSPWEECAHVLKRNFNLPEFPLLPLCSALIKLTCGYGLKDMSTVEALKKNNLPVLFIHGSNDTFVPVEMGKASYEACVSEKELIIVEGAVHAESFLKETERCTVALKRFLDKHLGK